MATNWITIDETKLDSILSGSILNQAVAADDTVTARTAVLRDQVVARIRGAIAAGAKTPLSLTSATVPPEAEQHALNLIAIALVGSTQSLLAVVAAMGQKTVMERQAEAAEEWIKKVSGRDGLQVTYPTDPAADTTFNQTVAGDIVGEVDMSTN